MATEVLVAENWRLALLADAKFQIHFLLHTRRIPAVGVKPNILKAPLLAELHSPSDPTEAFLRAEAVDFIKEIHCQLNIFEPLPFDRPDSRRKVGV